MVDNIQYEENNTHKKNKNNILNKSPNKSYNNNLNPLIKCLLSMLKMIKQEYLAIIKKKQNKKRKKKKMMYSIKKWYN